MFVGVCALVNACLRQSSWRAGILPYILHRVTIAEVRLESCNNSCCTTTSILRATLDIFLDCGFPINPVLLVRNVSIRSDFVVVICDGFCVFFYVEAFMAVALLHGQDTASVLHHLYKDNDGTTRWELQRLIIGYLNDHRDRAWRPCQVIKENKLTWEVFCLAFGLDLQSMVEKSRAMVRATRVDDVFDMLCPNQKTRDVLTISTWGLLIVQIYWTIFKKKNLDQRRGRILIDAFIAHCVRLGENVNDFVERLLDEVALTECSGTGERCVHLETALAAPHSCSGRAPLRCFLEALGQM